MIFGRSVSLGLSQKVPSRIDQSVEETVRQLAEVVLDQHLNHLLLLLLLSASDFDEVAELRRLLDQIVHVSHVFQDGVERLPYNDCTSVSEAAPKRAPAYRPGGESARAGGLLPAYTTAVPGTDLIMASAKKKRCSPLNLMNMCWR